MTRIAEATDNAGRALALANDTTRALPSPTTGDDRELAALVKLIEQKRGSAKSELDRATGEFRRYAERIAHQELEHWSAMTPERLRAQQEAEQAERIRAEQHKRHAAWKQLIAIRGERYERCRLANFQAETDPQQRVVQALRDYGADICEHVTAGQGIVLFGPSGTGKDHLLTALMRLAMFQAGLSVEWRSGPALWSELYDRMTIRDRTEREFLRPLIRAEVFALSDPTAQGAPLTDYQAGMLYRIIDERYNRQRPVWLTVNVSSRRELEELLGVPVVERLIHGALILPCNWPSYRTSGQFD